MKRQKILPQNIVWTEKEIRAAAKHFKTRRRFSEGNAGAYRAALRRGIIDDVCKHMELGVTGRPKKALMTKRSIMGEASKYSWVKDLTYHNPGILKAISAHGMMDQVKKVLRKNRLAA